MNRYGAALSTHEDLHEAVKECAAKALESFEGDRPDLCFFFVSHEHDARFDELPSWIEQNVNATQALGCAGETIVGPGQEVESGAALSLWVAKLPSTKIIPFCLSAEVEEGFDGKQTVRFDGMPDLSAVSGESRTPGCLLTLADPFSFPAMEWLQILNNDFAGLPVYGGMASGGRAPGSSRLFFGSQVIRDGSIGVLLEGAEVHHVVSQGCRPVGRSMVVTKAHDNVVEELAGKKALEQLQTVYDESDSNEKELLQRALQTGGLHIGQVVDEHKSNPERGDFLVRNVMGSVPQEGSILIGDYAQRGRTMRFHVRDAVSADEDLNELLASAKDRDPGAALLFSCNGRGSRLFEEPHHDAGCIDQTFPQLPVAGFFAQGEFGPVGGRNFLHGFTASIALFEGAGR